MTRRSARLLMAMLLALWFFGRRPSSPQAQAAPAPLLGGLSTLLVPAQRSYMAAGRPVIAGWPVARHFFARLGAPLPRSFGGPLYIDPEFQRWMLRQRPQILASAARHNHPRLTGMDDRQFAVVLAAILYLENNSALNDRPEFARAMTPLYEGLQAELNGLGTNFSMRPSNLRPSIAVDILNGRVPLPPNLDEDAAIYRPIQVHGSQLQAWVRRMPLVDGNTPPVAEVAAELSDSRLAIEYIAANLEVAQYRAEYEWVPVSWISLGTWHNQGLVSPQAIAASPPASLYVARLERYLPLAVSLVYSPPPASSLRGGPPAPR